MERAVERLRERGHVYEQDGATWFRSTTFGDDKDRVIIRSNGEPTYFASDIGYVTEKFARGFDRLIYIWGADHHGTVARVRNAAEAMGYDVNAVQTTGSRDPRRDDAGARRLADARAHPRSERRAGFDAHCAHDRAFERVRGLRAGGDDYVAKPFGRQELLARVDALLRRTRGSVRTNAAYADDLIEVDFAQATVRLRGEAVVLTPLEFRLLSAFVRHPNQVLSRDQLFELVWTDRGGASTTQVDFYVGYLRRKIGAGADRDGARFRLPLPA